MNCLTLPALLLTAFCFILLGHTPVRSGRTFVDKKIIETKVYTDVEMYKRWYTRVSASTAEKNKKQLHNLTQSAIKEYVSLCFHQANARLSTLYPTLPHIVELRLVAMEFNYAMFDDSGLTDIDEKHHIFKKFLQEIHKVNGMYDHTMLMTSLTLTTSFNTSSIKKGALLELSDDMAGYTKISEDLDLSLQAVSWMYRGASWNKICNPHGLSSSIIEDKGGFQSVFDIAHQIGHNLGAPHDGETEVCNDTDYNIMSSIKPENGPLASQWYFSKCSASEIHAFMSRSDRIDCLSNLATPLPEYEKTLHIVPGQKYPADQQCQMIYGSTSRVCLGPGLSSIGDICTSMFCLDPVASKSSPTGIECKKHFAAEGTSCGDGKWCTLGTCTSNPSAPTMGIETSTVQ
ncbi:A disintegrin and metalloproteinase with thrombospondin motifs 12-like [Physella acuta]|uniref:A disintegrin and metalloproteinase with thrombospondin motifs 12-like n=1 Tax=Physella acuta TaxID=109671 RepID=UPI0027DCA443|nr:A disintegrin and metalloproteinase with thrombospondin motifs 12-like [Physella acuta]